MPVRKVAWTRRLPLDIQAEDTAHAMLEWGNGVQGRMELELANAMTYSSYEHCEVEFPLDRRGYTDLLNDLIQENSKR